MVHSLQEVLRLALFGLCVIVTWLGKTVFFTEGNGLNGSVWRIQDEIISGGDKDVSSLSKLGVSSEYFSSGETEIQNMRNGDIVEVPNFSDLLSSAKPGKVHALRLTHHYGPGQIRQADGAATVLGKEEVLDQHRALLWRDRERRKSLLTMHGEDEEEEGGGEAFKAFLEDGSNDARRIGRGRTRGERRMDEARKLTSDRRRAVEDASFKTPLLGTTYPNGLYSAVFGIGSPPQFFNLDIDTGSNLLWMNCYPCNPCTSSKVLQMNTPFDPEKSSTMRRVQCEDARCNKPDFTVSTAPCNKTEILNLRNCSYAVAYGDGSSTRGTLLRDLLHFPATSAEAGETVVEVVFGCGNTQQGKFLTSLGWTYYAAIDGLIGFGRGGLSILTQAAQSTSLGSLMVHCLGGNAGGGWMALGQMPLPPFIAYTQLMPHPTFFRVGLSQIFVGGKKLSVNPRQYGNVSAGNAIFDSATTYSIMPVPFIPLILTMIQRKVGLPLYPPQFPNLKSICFAATDSLSVGDIIGRMPSINLQFQGPGTFLNVPPSTYAFTARDGSTDLVCTAIVGSDYIPTGKDHTFIIGELWMRDTLVVYDLPNNRIGWVPSKCS